MPFKVQTLMHRRGLLLVDVYKLIDDYYPDNPNKKRRMKYNFARLQRQGSDSFTLKTLKEIFNILELKDWNQIID